MMRWLTYRKMSGHVVITLIELEIFFVNLVNSADSLIRVPTLVGTGQVGRAAVLDRGTVLSELIARINACWSGGLARAHAILTRAQVFNLFKKLLEHALDFGEIIS
jgi:hypothetical protein